MSFYQGRDVQASLWWLLIIRDHLLWSRLPKDLVRHLLRYFLFSVRKCFCGRYFKLAFGSECSMSCRILFDNTVSLFGYHPLGSYMKDFGEVLAQPIRCMRCGIPNRVLWCIPTNNDGGLCDTCFTKFSKNGLCLEKIILRPIPPFSKLPCASPWPVE